jgi:threonine dehydrogenase-like Zn-dependent dehydrogenase
LSIGAHGIERANVAEGEYVLVIGAGPIGMGTMEFARIAGGKVIALDINEKRLLFCKEKLGVEHVINGAKDDVLNRLKEITNGDMPTVVVDATGNKKAINNAFQYMAHTARYVLVGLQKEEICFSHPEFHKREATLMSSRNATRKNFEFVMNAMQNGLINPKNYITHIVSFYNLAENFAQYIKPETGAIKVMTEF